MLDSNQRHLSHEPTVLTTTARNHSQLFLTIPMKITNRLFEELKNKMNCDENSMNSLNTEEDYNFGGDGLTEQTINGRTNNKRAKKSVKLDENVLKLRKTLYTFANETLKNLIVSPMDLSRFREEMNMLTMSDIEMSIENFTQNMFVFFNERFFFNILESVKINWSKRFKS